MILEDRLPKYFIVKKAIVENIDNELYRSNEAIPSEKRLMELYNVSRITIRKAIDELVTECYLYKIHCKGTYVKADEGSNNLFSITSSTEDVQRMGMTPSKKTKISKVENASPKRAKSLEISTDDLVEVIGRISYADKLYHSFFA